jgi:protein involved in plasmid replication-relaxation
VTARLTANRIWQLSYGLSQRDLAVVSTLAKVRVACVRQLESLHFAGQPRTARRVLAELTRRRIIGRLGRTVGGVRAGSAGHVYALDIVGQHLNHHGGPARGTRLRRPWTPGARFLAHGLAVTEIYVRLVELDRSGVVQLLEFQSEPECWRSFSPMGVSETLKPDGFARLGINGYEDSYFIEMDMGTESLRTIELKAEAYRRYYDSGEEQVRHGVFPKVLWLMPNAARARAVNDVVRPRTGDQPELHAAARIGDLEKVVAGSASQGAGAGDQDP